MQPSQRTTSQPSQPSRTKGHESQEHEKGEIIGTGAVRHVTETGLPPGITSDEAKDPGRANESGPVDNRS